MTRPAGVDVSHWQATTPDLSGLDFLFARATYGTAADDRYRMHVANARAAGLVVGAYHFGRALPVAGQVAAFLEVAGATAQLFVLDLESDAGHTPMSATQARAFIAGVKATGRRCGLYHSESGFPALGQDFDWVANWTREPVRPWTFWQHRGSPLDLDLFNGTRAELRAFAQEAFPMIPIKTNGPYDVTLDAGDQLYDQAFKALVKMSAAATVVGHFQTGTGFVGLTIVTGGKKQLAFAKVAGVAIAPRSYPVTVGGKAVGAVVLP